MAAFAVTGRGRSTFPRRGALVVAGLSAVALVGSTVGVPSASAAGTKAPITISAVLALSGTFGAYGTGDAAGAKAEVSLVNQAGGVLGRKLKLSVVDDGSTANKASVAAQQAVGSTPQPATMLAGATSVEAAAILPVTTRAKVVTMAPLGTDSLSDPSTYPYQFTTVQDATLRVTSVAKGFSNLGAKKIGIISSSDTGATTIAGAEASGLPKHGFDVVGTQSVQLTASDVSAPLQQLENDGAQAIYAYFTTPSLYVTMMNNLASLGWKSVKVMAAESALTATVMTAIPPAVAKQFVVLGPTALGRTGSTLPAPVAKFVAALKQAGGSTSYLYSSMLAADTVVLTSWAIKSAGSAEPTSVLTALNKLHAVNLPASVKASLLAMPPPKWSPTNHGLAGADNAKNWSLLDPGTPVTGTYQLSSYNH